MSGNLHRQPQQQAGKVQQLRSQVSRPALGLSHDFGMQPYPHLPIGRPNAKTTAIRCSNPTRSAMLQAPHRLQHGLSLVTSSLSPRVVTDHCEVKGDLDGTRLGLLQYPTNRRRCPQTAASSGGRFLEFTPEYLRTAIYRSGRALTVAGEARGQWHLPVGEMVYRYPLLAPCEMYLWPEGVTIPRCSTLALVLGSVRAHSRY